MCSSDLDLGRGDPEALQAFFVGLVAPTQQAMEMHHPGRIGVAEANRAAELQPGFGVGNQRSQCFSDSRCSAVQAVQRSLLFIDPPSP